MLARRGVVLCAGGFEANAKMRKEYLGETWERAYVRGTRQNKGECLQIAIEDLRATTAGDWAGFHYTC